MPLKNLGKFEKIELTLDTLGKLMFISDGFMIIGVAGTKAGTKEFTFSLGHSTPKDREVLRDKLLMYAEALTNQLEPQNITIQ